MKLTIKMDREADGRWIATVEQLPGVSKYGKTEDEAIRAAKGLALWRIGDMIEHGELPPELDSLDIVEFQQAA
jgi:predicted RNase H-like HicB family nuclease